MKSNFTILLFLCLSFSTKAEKSDTLSNAIVLDTMITACQGDLVFGVYDMPGIYIDTLVTNSICTIRTTTLTHFPQTPDMQSLLCVDENDPTLPGIYTEEMTDSNGCTYLNILNVVINPHEDVTTNTSLCEGDVYMAPDGTIIDQDTTLITEVTSPTGCTFNQILVLDFIATTQGLMDTMFICDNDIITWNGQDYTLPGTYTVVHTDPFGCTYDDVLTLFQGTPGTITENYTLCPGEQLNYQGVILTAPGIYYFEYLGATPCADSVDVILEFHDQSSVEVTAGVYCEGDTISWNGLEITSTGTFSAEIADSNGCDFTAVLNATFLPPADCAADVEDNPSFRIDIYPNPTSNELNVVLNEKDQYDRIEIYNMSGQLISFQEISSTKEIVTVTDLKSGIYLVKILDTGNAVTAVKLFSKI